MASLKTVTSKIAAFALIYRPNMSLQECQILSTEYQQSFQNLSDAEFLDAANLVKEKCTFFPTPADIYKAHQSQSSKGQANKFSNELAFEYTPEKAELNKTYAKIFMQALHGNQKAKDFFTLNLSPNSPEWNSQVAELSQSSSPVPSPAQKDQSDTQKSQKLKANCAQKDQSSSSQASPHARPVSAQVPGQVPAQTSTPVSQNKPVPELIHT